MSKGRRKLLITLFISLAVILAGGLIYQKFSIQKKSTVKKGPKKAAIREVQTATFEVGSIDNRISIDGRLSAYQKITLSAEVQGVLKETSKPFKEGTYFEEGDLLFRIDGENSRLNVLAQRANLLNALTLIMPDLKFDYPAAFPKWKSYLDNFEVERNLKPLPEVSGDQEKYFIAGKNIYSLFYSIKSLESQLKKFDVYAPFSGVVTQANTFTGQLVNPGVVLGTIMNTARYELSAPISLAEMSFVNIGQEVELSSEEMDKKWKGKVSRISRVIDPATQSLPVFISVYGKGLRDGMYLNGSLKGKALDAVIGIPKSQLIDQNHLFIVENSKIVKKEIQLIRLDDKLAYVKGVDKEDKVIVSVVNGLYEGQKVEAVAQKETSL